VVATLFPYTTLFRSNSKDKVLKIDFLRYNFIKWLQKEGFAKYKIADNYFIFIQITDNIIKEVQKNNEEIHRMDNNISQDINELKKSIKYIEIKIKSMDQTLEKLFDILNTITVFIEESGEEGELDLNEEDGEDWTPYDERNFSYSDDDDDEDDDQDNYGDSYYNDYEK
jgi:hypothetical protein